MRTVVAWCAHSPATPLPSSSPVLAVRQPELIQHRGTKHWHPPHFPDHRRATADAPHALVARLIYLQDNRLRRIRHTDIEHDASGTLEPRKRMADAQSSSVEGFPPSALRAGPNRFAHAEPPLSIRSRRANGLDVVLSWPSAPGPAPSQWRTSHWRTGHWETGHTSGYVPDPPEPDRPRSRWSSTWRGSSRRRSACRLHRH